MTEDEKYRILSLTEQMDTHLYEISKLLERLGKADEMDVFWAIEINKQMEDIANGKT